MFDLGGGRTSVTQSAPGPLILTSVFMRTICFFKLHDLKNYISHKAHGMIANHGAHYYICPVP